MSRPGSASPTVSVLLVSHNNEARTRECLAAISGAAGRIAHEVIVIDTGSHDGTVELIEVTFPHVKLIVDADVVGHAAAIDVAAREARGEFLLLLDITAIPGVGAIDRLVQFARCCADAQIWGGRVLYADGTCDPTSCAARMTLWSLFTRAFGLTDAFGRTELFDSEGYGGWARDGARRVDIVSNRFMLVRRTFWHELGGFDTRLSHYGADADFCLRAVSCGATPMVTADAEIVLYGRGVSPLRADRMIRQLAGRATLIRRHFPQSQVPLALALLTAWPLTRTITTALAAIASRREDVAATARTWQQIWLRRKTWLAGAGRQLPDPIAGERRSALPAR